MRLVLQELVEVRSDPGIGARRYERSDVRTTERNGHRQKTLSTKAGDVEVGIPKLRKGSFFPSILEPRRRIVAFGRWRVSDVRSILEAGAGVVRPAAPGEALIVPLPVAATRPLSAYAPEELR